jgi:hypothetical protein
MPIRITRPLLLLGLSMASASLQPAFARGGGGPPVWTMTLNYCREMVTNKGITNVARFEEEVKRCVANPITYPPAYSRPSF